MTVKTHHVMSERHRNEGPLREQVFHHAMSMFPVPQTESLQQQQRQQTSPRRDKWFRHGVFPRTTKGCLARLDRSIYTKKVKNTEFCPGREEVSEPGVGMDPPVRGEYPGSASPLPPPPGHVRPGVRAKKTSKTHMHSYRHLHLMTRPDVAR